MSYTQWSPFNLTSVRLIKKERKINTVLTGISMRASTSVVNARLIDLTQKVGITSETSSLYKAELRDDCSSNTVPY